MLPHCARRVNPRGYSMAVRHGTGAHRVASVVAGLTALGNADWTLARIRLVEQRHVSPLAGTVRKGRTTDVQLKRMGEHMKETGDDISNQRERVTQRVREESDPCFSGNNTASLYKVLCSVSH